MSKKFDYDLIVIGSGAGGSVGAHHARSLGKKVAIVEKGEIGGECPNFACVPTKALLHAANVYETVQNAGEYGTEAKITGLKYSKVKKWKDLVVERTGVTHGEAYLRKDGIDVIKGHANFLSPHIILVGNKSYSAAKFLIATGSSVFIPPVPGLKEAGYMTFKEAVEMEKLPRSMFILGGGPIGCEFTQAFATFGVKVTLADSLPRLIAKEDEEVSELLKALFEIRGVNVLTGISVDKVENRGIFKRIHFTKNGSKHHIDVEKILVATGKRPILSFEPENAGIVVENGHLQVNQHLQTSVPHIYAAGDLVGPLLFTHTGYYQSYIAVNNMFSHDKMVPSYLAIPRCVFTSPEVASVGLSEESAKASGIKIKVGMSPISLLGRANTSNELDGFIKIITDRSDTIIGAAIVAPHAGEMIHELTLAVKLKVKATVIRDMLHAYPTFSEGIKIACSNLEVK